MLPPRIADFMSYRLDVVQVRRRAVAAIVCDECLRSASRRGIPYGPCQSAHSP